MVVVANQCGQNPTHGTMKRITTSAEIVNCLRTLKNVFHRRLNPVSTTLHIKVIQARTLLQVVRYFLHCFAPVLPDLNYGMSYSRLIQTTSKAYL